MTPTRAAFVLVVAGLVGLTVARWRHSPYGAGFITAGVVVLAVYAIAFAAGDIDCADRGDCSALRGPLRIVLLTALAVLVVVPVVAALHAGLRPRAFRTSTGRRPRGAVSASGPRRRGTAAAFAPDRGLQVRMVVAIVVAAALLVAVLAGLVYLATTPVWIFVMCVLGFVVVGVIVGHFAELKGRRHARHPDEDDQDRVDRAVRGLCMLGGLTVPQMVVERHLAPLSWTVAGLRRRPHVHLTTGLLDRLDDRELAAVVAHELSHIAQGDAVLMTIIAGPSAAFFRGLRAAIDADRLRGAIVVLSYGLWLVPVALVLRATALVVSRHRELTADRGAAVLTGSPAAVASALTSVAAGLAERRARDLRRVRAGDVFHLLPSRRDEPGPLVQLWSTHPRLHRRLAQLEAMEERLQR